MSELPVHLFEGLLFQKGHSFWIQCPEEEIDLLASLLKLEGKRVVLSAHHLPSNPPEHVAGLGSCMWGEFCPAGHKDKPLWLWQQHLRGLLRLADGNVFVEGEQLRVDMLLGHKCRLVVAAEFESLPNPDFDALGEEASRLLGIISALQAHMKEDK